MNAMHKITRVPTATGELWRSDDTGMLMNPKDFSVWEKTAELRKGDRYFPHISPAAGECFLLMRWAVVLHPWSEVIPPSLNVDLIVNDFILIKEMPLFSIAEPLKRSKDCDIERRITKIEKQLGLSKAKNPSGFLGAQLINQNHKIQARINGPSDDLAPIMEMTKHCLLHLSGFHRCAIRI
jgi:hypothetical protein